MKTVLIIFTLFASVLSVRSQFAPPAGEEGSNAIYVDSTVFIQWATHCKIERGWMNVADTLLGKTVYGDSLSATGKADNGVVSLGDGGIATLYFSKPIANGEGWDFAVFENAFNDDFLELAFVEVSSDGLNFFRFKATSLTQTETQVETFGTLDATKINNLAGKYRVFYGTPFDLEELKDEEGLNVNHIVAVKIVDVVGSVDDRYSTFDGEGNIVNDPWPTPFETGGFDLDAVGVIHNTSNTSVVNHSYKTNISVYPNPCSNYIMIQGKSKMVTVFDVTGRVLITEKSKFIRKIDFSSIPKGLIVVSIIDDCNNVKTFKVVKK